MAIDWKVKFTKKTNGHYSAVFNRFDTIASDVMLATIPILDAILDNDEQKVALWNQVFAKYEKQAEIDAVIADLETESKTALMAKEK